MPKKKELTLYDTASQLYRQSRFEESITLCEQVLLDCKVNVKALYIDSLIKTHQWDKLKEYMKEYGSPESGRFQDLSIHRLRSPVDVKSLRCNYDDFGFTNCDFVSPSVTTRYSVDKGRGLWVECDVEQYSPLVVSNSLAVGHNIADLENQVRILLERNPKTIKRRFDHFWCGVDVESVCARNSFVLESFADDRNYILNEALIPDGERLAALFTDASLVNHDCYPNCFRVFFGHTVVIVAGRHINEGEEITISYIPWDMQKEERRELLSQWGFICQCQRCLGLEVDLTKLADPVRCKMLLSDAMNCASLEQQMSALESARDLFLALGGTWDEFQLAVSGFTSGNKSPE